MRNVDDMRSKWNRRMTGSILSPNPTGMLVDMAIRKIKYFTLKKKRNG
jgi:hypothetical protein